MADISDEIVSDQITRLGASITRHSTAESFNKEKLLKNLRELANVEVTAEILLQTKLGLVVAALRVHEDSDIAKLSKAVRKLWKKAVSEAGVDVKNNNFGPLIPGMLQTSGASKKNEKFTPAADLQIMLLSRRSGQKKLAMLRAEGYTIVDVTSKGTAAGFNVLSPFYPFKTPIAVPLLPEERSFTVEAVWQGLKVFEKHGIDLAKFQIQNGKNLKRTCRKYGRILGHFGGRGKPLLGIGGARRAIYIPAYQRQLETSTSVKKLNELRSITPKIVLLDYFTNNDVDSFKPLSHASLIRTWLLHGNFESYFIHHDENKKEVEENEKEEEEEEEVGVEQMRSSAGKRRREQANRTNSSSTKFKLHKH